MGARAEKIKDPSVRPLYCLYSCYRHSIRYSGVAVYALSTMALLFWFCSSLQVQLYHVTNAARVAVYGCRRPNTPR